MSGVLNFEDDPSAVLLGEWGIRREKTSARIPKKLVIKKGKKVWRFRLTFH